MALFDLRFKKKTATNYIALQYSTTGMFGYSLRDGQQEVLRISCMPMPNPDIYISGFNKELKHEHYNREMTLVPGVRRNFVDRLGNTQAYYKYISLNEFCIVAGSVRALVKGTELGWDIYDEKKQIANIRRISRNESRRFVENGCDMEAYFSINMYSTADIALYPYIMAIPMLRF